MFDRIVRNVRAFRAMQRALGARAPRVSLWLTGLKETIAQLADFVRLAHDIGRRRGLSAAARLFPRGTGAGAARIRHCSPAATTPRDALIREAEALARELGISFNASGATDPAAA